MQPAPGSECPWGTQRNITLPKKNDAPLSSRDFKCGRIEYVFKKLGGAFTALMETKAKT